MPIKTCRLAPKVTKKQQIPSHIVRDFKDAHALLYTQDDFDSCDLTNPCQRLCDKPLYMAKLRWLLQLKRLLGNKRSLQEMLLEPLSPSEKVEDRRVLYFESKVDFHMVLSDYRTYKRRKIAPFTRMPQPI